MIWALLFMMMFGSSDSALVKIFDEASARVSTVVEDTARAKEIDAIIERAAKATSDFEKAREKNFARWIDLSRQGDDAGVAAYEELFKAIAEQDEVWQRSLIEQRGALQEKLSREEWEKIFPAPVP